MKPAPGKYAANGRTGAQRQTAGRPGFGIIKCVSAIWTTHTSDAAGTQAFAARIAPLLAAGDVLWLSGDLGSGKTTFTQGLGRALGIGQPIVSPTFVLIREYAGRLPLYHIDLYRLDNPREALNLGLRDYLDGDGVCVIEWAERFDSHGDLPGLHIHIEPQGDSGRRLDCGASGARAETLLAQITAN